MLDLRTEGKVGPVRDCKHTFVVSAYGESPFLEECVKSLVSQTIKSDLIVATSTPNDAIRSVSDKYDIRLCVRDGEPGIAPDWNYAIACARSRFVTIAHQDDTYSPDYAERAVLALSAAARPLIFFTDYGELRNGGKVENAALSGVKRRLLVPYRFKGLSSLKAVKRLPISLGNPICCPAVTYALENLPTPLFQNGLKSNLDWDAWERFSRLPGSFLYDPSIGMYHRVHEGSETSACIADDTRTKEDLAMLERFWPSAMAKLINSFYEKAQNLN